MNFNITTNLADQIIRIIDVLAQRFGIAVDWTADNIMPYIEGLVEHLIKWEISTSYMWIGICLFIVLFFAIFAAMETWGSSDFNGFCQFMFCISFCASVVVIGVQVYDIITCSVFPEKYVFEYVKGYLNTIK